MSYEIVLSPRASKDLRSLPLPLRSRVLRKLEEAREEPARYFRRLTNEDALRMRVGDHRVIVDIDEKARVIRVHHVGHRKNVYD